MRVTTSEQRPEQGALFADPGAPEGDGVTLGYRGPTACSAAGITYRQLDYWARTGLVLPTVRTASGSGSQRLYSFKDILVLKVVKRLLDAGVSLQNIRIAVEALRLRGVDDLAQLTLLSDGTSVYECTSSEEVVDLLRGGQGVFGIAVSGALRELRGSLEHLPAERADGIEETDAHYPSDELAQRRRQQRSAAADPCATAEPDRSTRPAGTAGGDEVRHAPCLSCGAVAPRVAIVERRPPNPRGRAAPGSIASLTDGAEGATSPEPLRHQDRADEATLKGRSRQMGTGTAGLCGSCVRTSTGAASTPTTERR